MQIKPIKKTFSDATKDNLNDNNPFLFAVNEMQQKRALNPPVDNDMVEDLHGTDVSDPFRPLEDLTAPDTQNWIDRQNVKFEKYVSRNNNVRKNTVSFLQNARPQGMRESMPSKRDGKYVVWRKQENEARHSLWIKDVPDYGAPARLLLDPAQIDPSGKTNISGTYFSRDGKTLGYTLSVSGSDETTLKFRDVATGQDIDLAYKNFRFGITWDRDGKGFRYRRPVQGLEKSFEVCHHVMGTDPTQDTIIHSPSTPETSASIFRLLHDSKDEPGTYEWLWIRRTKNDENTLLVRPHDSAEDYREIFSREDDITLSPIEEIDGMIYAETNLDAPNGKLVCFDVNNPDPKNWHTILPENEDDPLKDVFVWQNRLFATYSHDTGEVWKIYDLSGKHLHDAPIPPLSTFSTGQILIENSACLLTYDNFQESGNIYNYDVIANTLTLYRKSSMPIDLKDCIVERAKARSKDGTMVPMTVIRAPSTQLDGTAATLLYGYGGFDVALDPYFSSEIAQWIRSGGIYVQANLRGGGEYGKTWCDAGRKENKQNVFDDFAGCAEHLIKNNYTSSKRLAIQGGSNGGLLTLATALQRPELFGAIISEVPVADMFRFHVGSYYGYGWKSDYGDMSIKQDFNIAAKYSPLHNVNLGFEHPPILIKTDAHDDRVLPWHSYKMAATLQAREGVSSITLLKTRTNGGHSAGMTEQQQYEDVAEVRAFLEHALGPINQTAYKARQAKKATKNKTPNRKKSK